ncbi:hypothetical protein IIC65_00535, partial [Candidatus Sumerlaeota bacterium]|nr:hypothetical protein [Candidatus Sumerlaeota bacterium]
MTKMAKVSFPAIVAAALLTVPLYAANHLQFFFPVENSPFTRADDQVVVKSIFWDTSQSSPQWIIYRPNNQ